jgi:hypothetical protein
MLCEAVDFARHLEPTRIGPAQHCDHAGAFLVSERLEHDTSPNVLRQRYQVQRGLAICLVLAPLVIAASSSTGAVAARTGQPAAGMSATSSSAIVGTWRRATTCSELVKALTSAGLKKFVLESVAGNGFIPGVTNPDQIANPASPCKGAVVRKHSHFFTKDKKFGSLDWKGEQVDDGTYRLLNNRTFVISKEFPNVTFHFRIRGNTITFAPVIARGCATFRCAWAISMAYPSKSWQRVR